MEKEALKRVFDFLEEKEGYKVPFLWKLFNNIPLTKEELIVDDDLDLSYTDITSLPEGLKVYGDLHLDMTKFLKSLPEGLEVGGDLELNSSSIKSLPKGLNVRGNLNLNNSKITSFPEGLEVGGDLDLIESDIEFLPKGLEVGGFIFIYNTPLTEYTNNELIEMIKPGFIKGRIIR